MGRAATRSVKVVPKPEVASLATRVVQLELLGDNNDISDTEPRRRPWAACSGICGSMPDDLTVFCYPYAMRSPTKCGWPLSSAWWLFVIGAVALLGCDQTIGPEAGPAPGLSTSSTSEADAQAVDPENLDAATFGAILESFSRQTGGGRRGKMTPAGLVLGPLEPDDSLAKIGLLEGDLITKLNEHRTSDPDYIWDAMLAVRRAGTFDAHVLRPRKQLRVFVASPSWLAENPPRAGSSTSGAATDSGPPR